MQIELLSATPLKVASYAIRNCWQSFDKGDDGGEKDIALMDRVINKHKHESMAEFIDYVFDIKDISLSCSHQLVRHRTFTFAQKSSRYTLKELKNEDSFISNDFDYKKWLENKLDAVGCIYSKRASKYLVWTEDDMTDTANVIALDNLRRLIQKSKSNDIAKHAMPTAYKTQVVMKADVRNLKNFLKLRLDKSAHKEIRELANKILEAIPYEHKFLFKEFII